MTEASAKMYGLIGYPLGHSFSAKYFNEKFAEEGIDNSYRLFPLQSIDELGNLLESYPALQGLNITIPYKEKVIPFLSDISPEALAIGAVNVIKINNYNEGRIPILSGYNTDWKGFSLSLIPLLNESVKSALVLGTGGASKAVCYALKRLGITPHLVSRSHSSSEYIYKDLNEDIIKENLLIVNTTPLGMSPNVVSCPDIPYHYLTDRHICYDLVYNPEVTEFMTRSAHYGATVKNGLEMLHRQAELSWEIWNAR
ncbi:MAG: shikimate dehydrogenase [Muribaculaceae bacterium]|nr:shikimate dehydrogenase [Muribaculaceae bacterium]